MHTGSVKWFNKTKGFGFIVPDKTGPDVFVHVTDVQKSGLHTLIEDQRVEYDIAPSVRTKKPNAVSIKVIG